MAATSWSRRSREGRGVEGHPGGDGVVDGRLRCPRPRSAGRARPPSRRDGPRAAVDTAPARGTWSAVPSTGSRATVTSGPPRQPSRRAQASRKNVRSGAVRPDSRVTMHRSVNDELDGGMPSWAKAAPARAASSTSCSVGARFTGSASRAGAPAMPSRWTSLTPAPMVPWTRSRYSHAKRPSAAAPGMSAPEKSGAHTRPPGPAISVAAWAMSCSSSVVTILAIAVATATSVSFIWDHSARRDSRSADAHAVSSRPSCVEHEGVVGQHGAIVLGRAERSGRAGRARGGRSPARTCPSAPPPGPRSSGASPRLRAPSRASGPTRTASSAISPSVQPFRVGWRRTSHPGGVHVDQEHRERGAGRRAVGRVGAQDRDAPVGLVGPGHEGLGGVEHPAVAVGVAAVPRRAARSVPASGSV